MSAERELVLAAHQFSVRASLHATGNRNIPMLSIQLNARQLVSEHMAQRHPSLADLVLKAQALNQTRLT